MYNKLFTKILDSSIWMENHSTRIVWITLLAAMDEDGIAHFAGIKNLAYRAIVSEEDTSKAIEVLSSNDPDSSDPEFDGKRIEKFDGGWIILNAHKYREIITKLIAREKTRIRVAEFRDRKRKQDCNATVTPNNDSVTPSDTVSVSVSVSDKNKRELVRKPKNQKTSFPEKFQVTEAMGQWAEQQGLASIQIKIETEQFQDHCVANGKIFSDWIAAWRTWIRNSIKFSKPKGGQLPNAKPGKYAGVGIKATT